MEYENTFLGLAFVYGCAGIFYHGSMPLLLLLIKLSTEVLLLCGTGDKFGVLWGQMDLPLLVITFILS